MPDIVEKVYGYHIYYWSNECIPLEPIHFHVSKRPHASATKIWILRDGSLEIANNADGIPINDLKRIMNFMSMKENVEIAKEKWKNHFGEISFYK